MRKDVRRIFIETPKKKHVMLFSAMMTSETRVLCKKFISDPHEIRVDEESKLTLHGLGSFACSGIQPGCGLREVCSESDRSRQVARQGFVRVDFVHPHQTVDTSLKNGRAAGSHEASAERRTLFQRVKPVAHWMTLFLNSSGTLDIKPCRGQSARLMMIDQVSLAGRTRLGIPKLDTGWRRTSGRCEE